MSSNEEYDAQREVPRHPIQVVARRTGLTPDLLRAWEKRYGAVRPHRNPKNRRLYSDMDVERLRLLQQLTTAGRRIGDVAGLSDAELAEYVSADRKETVAPVPAAVAPLATDVSDRMDECLRAVRSLDGAALQRALEQAAADWPPQVLVEGLLAPLLVEIGEGWHRGELRVVHEHFATAVLRSFLGRMPGTRGGVVGEAAMVVATPHGQLHELGALMVAIAATLDGWAVTYLGAGLSAEEIAAGARLTDASVVALSLVYPPDDSRLEGELRRLRELLERRVEIVAGGASAQHYGPALEAAGARYLGSLAELRDALAVVRKN